MPGSRKVLPRNKDFAKRAEKFENLKGVIKHLEGLLEKLGIRQDMLDRYGDHSTTIPVFKSYRGLRVKLKVDRVPITKGEILRQTLGDQFRYPLVRRKDEYTVNLAVLRRRVRQGKLPKGIEAMITAPRITVDTYVPKPQRRMKE